MHVSIKCLLINYLNKTIMEVEAEEGGGHPLLFRDGGLNHRVHGDEHFRATLLVIISR